MELKSWLNKSWSDFGIRQHPLSHFKY